MASRLLAASGPDAVRQKRNVVEDAHDCVLDALRRVGTIQKNDCSVLEVMHPVPAGHHFGVDSPFRPNPIVGTSDGRVVRVEGISKLR